MWINVENITAVQPKFAYTFLSVTHCTVKYIVQKQYLLVLNQLTNTLYVKKK